MNRGRLLVIHTVLLIPWFLRRTVCFFFLIGLPLNIEIEQLLVNTVNTINMNIQVYVHMHRNINARGFCYGKLLPNPHDTHLFPPPMKSCIVSVESCEGHQEVTTNITWQRLQTEPTASTLLPGSLRWFTKEASNHKDNDYDTDLVVLTAMMFQKGQDGIWNTVLLTKASCICTAIAFISCHHE